jgi:hypothetical protein
VTLVLVPVLPSCRAVSRDAGEVGAERALRAPEVVRHLHAQPELGAVAAELAEAERHLGGDCLLAPQQAVEGHPADAELARGRGHRELSPSARISRSSVPGWVGQRAGRSVTG